MGLGSDILLELIELRRAKALVLAPKVVEIGAQQLSNDFLRAGATLKEVFELFGRSTVPQLDAPIDGGLAAGLELQAQEAPSSQSFWEALGFEYAAIDFDGHRHSQPLDLNINRVPKNWRNRFDLVINAGTTEHIANQDNAFRVIHDLVCKGGIMMHDVPAAGMLTHGLVTYTMKFFWHLCRENNYEVLRLEMTPGGVSPLPDNVVATSVTFGRNHGEPRFRTEPIRDWTIRATLRKISSHAYVTPLDVPVEIMPTMRPALTTRGLQRIWRYLNREAIG